MVPIWPWLWVILFGLGQTDQIKEVYNFPRNIFPWEEIKQGKTTLEDILSLAKSKSKYNLVTPPVSLKLQGLTNLGHDEGKVRASVAEELIERMANDGKELQNLFDLDVLLVYPLDLSIQAGTHFEIIAETIDGNRLQRRDTKAELKQSNQYFEDLSGEEGISNASRYSDISSNEYSSSDNYSSSEYAENSYDSEDDLELEDDSSTIIIELEEYEEPDVPSEIAEQSSEASSEEFGAQSNIIFGITTENGDSMNITLQELENDPRIFLEGQTIIDSYSDTVVNLETEFSYTGFDNGSINKFFDFRDLLWDRVNLEFASLCFRGTQCSEESNKIVTCQYEYFKEEDTCENLQSTSFSLNKKAFEIKLPVNRYPPLIFDPSDTIGSTVKIDSCQPDFYLVVEDLDGNAAALNPPTIEIRNNESVLKMEAPFNLNNYEHGLILYNGTIPKSFNAKLETELLILDHPISEFDQKSSKYKVEWDHQKCDTDKIQDPVIGKTVYHKVIPNCSKGAITQSIQASLRQVKHIMNLEILQLSLSDKSEGINVVITSSANVLSDQQRAEMEDAINIGRILVQCLAEDESVDEVLSTTSNFSKRKTESERKSAEKSARIRSGETRTVIDDHESAATDKKSLIVKENMESSKKDYVIFIIPVSCLIVFAGVFIQCVIIKQDPKLQRGDVDVKSIIMRVALELGFITECALACKVYIDYKSGGELFVHPTPIIIPLSTICILLFAPFAFSRYFILFRSIMKNQSSWMEPIIVQLEILIRFMPFSVIMLIYFSKFRAQTLPDHKVIIALYTIQTILASYANILFCLKIFKRFDRSKRFSNANIHCILFGLLFMAQFLFFMTLIYSPTSVTADYSCIWINGETSASYAWPQKCFDTPEILVLTFSFFGLLSITFCIHSFIYHRYTSEKSDRRQSPTTGKPAIIINRDEEVIFSQN